MTYKINYDDFVEKFKPKLTTDDCYTPEAVYNEIKDWAIKEYGIIEDKIVRPFYPGGDYENFDYSDDKVVVDNPPFSILSNIINFYIYHGIKFFLFAPCKTLFSNGNKKCCFICGNEDIIYENGARVKTSFITNFEDAGVRNAPDLGAKIKQVQETHKELPKYKYPSNVLTFSSLDFLSKNNVEIKIGMNELYFIRVLDEQKKHNKKIFGAGFLMSNEAMKRKLELENKIIQEKAVLKEWQLSEREQEIIKILDE